MSLSTLTQCNPKVCRLPRTDRDVSNTLREPPPPAFEWHRVRHSSLIAALATTLSQIVSSPLDVSTRTLKLLPTSSPLSQQSFGNMFRVLFRILRNRPIHGPPAPSPSGLIALFEGLPLHLMKRVPTKALTVALFEVSAQVIADAKLNPMQHVSIAMASGALALMLCYPMHMVYYVMRKRIPFAKIASKAMHRPSILYTGSIPALVGTLPAVIIDYAAYSILRKKIDAMSSTSPSDSDHGRADDSASKALPITFMLVIAAASANVFGGFMSEPFKAVGRKMAVQAVRGGPVPLSKVASTPSMSTIVTGSVSPASKFLSKVPSTMETFANKTSATTAMATALTPTVTNVTSPKVISTLACPKVKTAVGSVTENTTVSIGATANAMFRRGVGEFWSGFQLRSIRYFVSAVVSKATVQHLRELKERNGSADEHKSNSDQTKRTGIVVYTNKGSSIQNRVWDQDTILFDPPKREYASHSPNRSVVATFSYSSPRARGRTCNFN